MAERVTRVRRSVGLHLGREPRQEQPSSHERIAGVLDLLDRELERRGDERAGVLRPHDAGRFEQPLLGRHQPIEPDVDQLLDAVGPVGLDRVE
jgi:hypothetical protein